MTREEAQTKVNEARRTLELLAPEFYELEPQGEVVQRLGDHALDLILEVVEEFGHQVFTLDDGDRLPD